MIHDTSPRHQQRRPVYQLVVAFTCGFLVSGLVESVFEIGGMAKMIASVQVTRSVQVVTKEESKYKPPRSWVQAPFAHKPRTAANNTQSSFNDIVAKASHRALKPDYSVARNSFDIEWWENESGLTTQGGLGQKDRMLLADIYTNANSVFEYGLGESTYLANYVGVPRYAGIDSDPVWVGMARDHVSDHFRFYLGDVGMTGAWGRPNRTLHKQVMNYQLAPLILEMEPFDVYMVDGRWRLPSMIASFLHASDRGASPEDTVVLIHDCSVNRTIGRTGYKRADHLLDLKHHSGGALCVYQRKPDTTDDQLRDLWFKHMDECD